MAAFPPRGYRPLAYAVGSVVFFRIHESMFGATRLQLQYLRNNQRGNYSRS